MYGEGISYELDLINTGIRYGTVKRSGASYTFGEVKLGTGLDAAKNFLKADPKLAGAILTAIKSAVASGTGLDAVTETPGTESSTE
jgi:recombination protein RecA